VINDCVEFCRMVDIMWILDDKTLEMVDIMWILDDKTLEMNHIMVSQPKNMVEIAEL